MDTQSLPSWEPSARIPESEKARRLPSNTLVKLDESVSMTLYGKKPDAGIFRIVASVYAPSKLPFFEGILYWQYCIERCPLELGKENVFFPIDEALLEVVK